MVTKEQGVEVCSAGTGLKGEDSPAVLRQVEVLEHVEGLKISSCYQTILGCALSVPVREPWKG